jgi:L-seryl-tRNA(Ser) seleniumtransferase
MATIQSPSGGGVAIADDKLCLAGISATLAHYLKGEALEKIPVWRMISMDLEKIRNQANSWQKRLETGEIIPGSSMVGGGSLPGESQPTFLLALRIKNPDQFLQKLRALPVPVIARIEDERVVFDPRTVLPGQEIILLDELVKLIN